MPFASEELSDVEMRELLTRIALATERTAAALERMERRPRAGSAAGPTVASDADLDSQYGNPEIKKDPKRWDGASQAGRRMSECTPEYLDCCASFYDWQAEHATPYNGKTAEQVAGYRRKDAARARGWAARLRSGWKAPSNDADNGPANNNNDEAAGW